MDRYCSVIPLHTAYYRIDALTYSFPLDLDICPGDLVEIPLKNKFCYGIVSDISKENIPEFKNIKEVARIIVKKALYPYQIKVIQALLWKYLLSSSQLGAIFWPKYLIDRAEKEQLAVLTSEKNTQTLINEKPVVNIFPSSKELNVHISQTFLQENDLYKQRIYIFPNNFILQEFFNTLDEEGKKKCIIYQNDLTPTKKYKALLSLQKKENIILSDRYGLFLPLYPGAEIIYIEDAFESEFYLHPFFIKTLDIFLFMHTYRWWKSTLFTSVPSLQTMYAIKNGDFILL